MHSIVFNKLRLSLNSGLYFLNYLVDKLKTTIGVTLEFKIVLERCIKRISRFTTYYKN